MCDPVTTAALITAGTAAVATKYQANITPDMPSPPPLEKPPAMQASKLPDQQAKRQSKKTDTNPLAKANLGDTLLTGLGGVAPGSLNLGRNTLLGG